MQEPSHTPRLVMERVIAVVALGIAFIVMGSIIVPAKTPAESVEPSGAHGSSDGATGKHADNKTEAEGAAHSEAVHADLPMLGSFEGKRYRIHMYGTKIGVRYTVFDAESGETLGELLSLEQARRWFPDAALWQTDFSAPTESDNEAVMYGEPDPAAPGMH